MRQLFYKYGTNKLVPVSIGKYLIDWKGKSPSKLQKSVKDFLRPYWLSEVVLEEFRIGGSLLRCDFLNITRKICIEANGPQHSTFNPFFHNNSREKFRMSIARDFKKLEWLEQGGYKLIELIDADIKFLSPEYILNKFGIEII